MTTPSGYVRKDCFSALARLFMLVLLIVLSNATVQAQSDYGSTPLANAPGAPAGSYALSGIDNINLFNAHVSVRIPLVAESGRGGAKSQMMWVDGSPVPHHVRLDYDPWGNPQYWDEWTTTPRELSLGMPAVKGVQSGLTEYPCGGGSWHVFLKTLTRLSFVEPDGTEHELRDTATGGQPLAVSSCNPMYQGSRGRIFVTVDGSGATFIADNPIIDHAEADYGFLEIYPTGYLLLKDGTRYYFDANGGVTQRDRNGNILTMPYWNGLYGNQIKDSLNRVATRQSASGTQCTSLAPNAANYCDQIVYKGSGGAARALTIPYDSSSNEPIGIWLPNGQSYRFYYDTYGDLTRIDLPAGGSIEYTYGPGLTGQQPFFPAIQGAVPGTYSGGPVGSIGLIVYRRVEERRVYKEGHVLESRQTFSKPEDVSGSNLGYVEKKQYDANNNLLFSEKHYFYGSAKASFDLDGISYSPWKDGREYHTEFYDQNGNLLRQSDQTWEQRAPVSWWTGSPEAAPPNDARISLTWARLENGLTSATSYTFDPTVPYNSLTDVSEYDYGACCVPGPFLRRMQTTYLKTLNGVDYTGSNITDPSAPYLRDFPLQTSVFDPWGIERARTTFEYDNYTADSNHAALVPRPSISGLDAASTTTYLTRGNVTGTTRYLLTNGSVTGSISAYAQYDVAGNVVKTIDARGNATTVNFNDCFGTPDGNAHVNSGSTELNTPGQYSYAFPTLVTNAMGHTVYTQFDFYLGQPVDGEDPNGIVASGYYNDVLDRPTQIIRAVNTSAQNQTTFSYDDVNRIITTSSDLNGNDFLVSKVLYDGFGRTTETRQYEGSSHYIAVQAQYDALGRAYKSSNPFRPLAPDNETAVWTTSAFDALGRIVSVSTPDSAVVTTSYSGNTVTVTDQGGKARKSVTDALSRLMTIYEDPSGANLQTSYSYDVLDNLTTVSQGLQTRSFVYDSLKRLTSATNPESGTINYDYDNNGNLLHKTDARSITTTIAYDVLNRPTSKSYNDSPQTPPVNYFYDSQALPSGAPSLTRGASTGRLVAVTYGSGSSMGTYRGYDEMGRVVRQYQRTDSVNYLVEATYWANSSLHVETYPSVPGYGDRRTVTYTPDTAGRLGSLASNATTYAPAASISGIGYASHNALKTETYGNSLVHAITYNNRLQANEIKLGTSGNPTSVLDLSYNYGATNNNGNVQSIGYNGGGLNYTQTFGYDALNRLTTSVENSGSSWSQTNGYDRYGNRWINIGEYQNLYFSTSTNRITNSGYSYDAAGNLTNDTTHAYTFDAENKISKVDGVTAYTYDGEGQRVRKLVGENTRFVYGIGGQLIMEFDGASGNLKKEYVSGGGTMATIAPNGKGSLGTQYTTPDTLGTPRVVTKSGGSIVARHDYLPFGEELFAGTGGRTTGMGFGASDGVRQKFTQKERDIETGLDYFGARYYGSTMGRFTTPDPYMPSAEVTSPQSWNRYSYCLNNPLKYVDPTGLGYSDLDEAQRKLFQTYADKYNKENKTSLSAEQVYGTLDESQQATYEANTYAMEHTELHDKKGNDLGNALSLVKSVDQIVGENPGGDTHVRLYVTLTDNAIDTLGRSQEFSHDHDIFGLHHGYDESYRQKGGPPGLQFSYKSKDKIQGDIDIDYRSMNPLKGEGHTKHYNSDVRQLGPQTDDGNKIDNYQRYIDRWPGLHRWWEQKTRSNDVYEKKQ